MSSNNPNVLYEVGYAFAKNKLCILLSDNPQTIPFDLRNRRHIVFHSLKDLTKQLSRDLNALKVEAELAFDTTDSECLATVQAAVFETRIIGHSQATSIRARVKTGSELDRKDVSAHMIKIERRIRNRKWEQFKLEQAIQLTWVGTDTGSMDFSGSAIKFVNIFHIDHNENKLTIWKVPMSKALSKFLNAKAVYRVTVSVLERQIQLDIVWHRDWRTVKVQSR